jgi:hypothetical protein
MKEISKYFWNTKAQAAIMHSSILTEYKPLIEKITTVIHEAVKSFELYKTYQNEVELIFNPEEIINLKQKARYNIINGWNLTEKKSNSTPPTELILETLDPIYNNDKNVAKFITHLANKIYITNTPLYNDYFFFGLRKGVKNPVVYNITTNKLLQNTEIKTTNDYESLISVCKKITTKMFGNHLDPIALNKSIQENLIWANINKTPPPQQILIGLPYQERKEEKYEDLYNTIISIEKVFLEKKDTWQIYQSLKNDKRLKPEKRGEIWKIFNPLQEKKDEKTETKIPKEKAYKRILNENARWVKNNGDDICHCMFCMVSNTNDQERQSIDNRIDEELYDFPSQLSAFQIALRNHAASTTELPTNITQ